MWRFYPLLDRSIHINFPRVSCPPQVAEGSYDFEANKMLLKLYLLYPTLANQEIVEKVRRQRFLCSCCCGRAGRQTGARVRAELTAPHT